VKQIRQRLTYANVMSSIAVFFVLGGATAFAATKIGANELKANSVLTGKIKKEAITTSKIKNNSITTGKIADKAITAAKVDTTGLGTVPSATNAVNATNAINAVNAKNVNGQSIVKIFTVIPNGTTNAVIASFAGFTIRGDCTGSVVKNLLLDPPNNDSDLKAEGSGAGSGEFFDGNQGAEDNSVSLNDENVRGETSFSAATSAGTVVSGNIGYDDSPSFDNTSGCSFYGQAIFG
jgi:hypothetical protein